MNTAESSLSVERLNSVVLIGADGYGISLRDLFTNAGLKAVLLTDDADLERHVAEADLLIENLHSAPEGSIRIFSRCAGARPSTIFTTTSAFGITRLAFLSGRPNRFGGLHFVRNNDTGKWLVEIAKGLDTSAETVALCKNLAERAGIAAIEVADSPGLILDRVMACIINEAAFMLMTGVVTSAEDTDEIVRIRRNWPRGPFQIADEMGIDHVVATLEMLAMEKGRRYLPCRLLRRMQEANHLGRKTGRGFYSYG